MSKMMSLICGIEECAFVAQEKFKEGGDAAAHRRYVASIVAKHRQKIHGVIYSPHQLETEKVEFTEV